jgi:hypothetical protein
LLRTDDRYRHRAILNQRNESTLKWLNWSYLLTSNNAFYSHGTFSLARLLKILKKGGEHLLPSHFMIYVLSEIETLSEL